MMALRSAEGDDPGNVAAILVNELRGRTQSEIEVFTELQNELRRIARAKMRKERPDHTLQPTALVNEAFIKLHNTKLPEEFGTNKNRALQIVAYAMEQVLNDWADAHSAKKRGGPNRQRVPLDDDQARDFARRDEMLRLDSALVTDTSKAEDILDVRQALSLLRKAAPRQARILQLQFYCGLTQEEISKLLELSIDTIKQETRKAKAFLRVSLANDIGSV
jgi:RNA polymerase sigma factor (sigma-70 family)